MRRGDPKSLNDEALAQVSASAPVEQALLSAGCLGSVVLLLLAAVSLLAFGTLGHPLFMAPAVIVAALFCALYLVARPKRRYREELTYRCGRSPFSEYFAEARAVLCEQEADWVVLFTIAALPNGDFRWVRLALKERPPSGRADLRISESGLSTFKRIERDVPDAIVQDLLAFLKELETATLSDLDAPVMDGTPCRLAILRPSTLATASCNLMGLSPEQVQHPTALACAKLSKIVCRELLPEQGAP